MARLTSELATERIDRYYLDYPTCLDDPIDSAIEEIQERQREIRRTNQRDPSVDFDFEVVIFPQKQRLYGMLFTEHLDWIEDFFSHDIVTRYEYYQGVRPANVSQQEWARREKTWTRIFEESHIPSQVGLVASCNNALHTLLPSVYTVIEQQPSFEERVQKATNLLANDSKYNGIKAPKIEDFMSWIRSDERKKLVEELKPMVKNKLKKELTFDDFTKKLQ